MDQVVSMLTPDMFYLEKHQTVAKAIWTLYGQNRNLDSIAVMQELSRMKVYEENQYPFFLSKLTDRVSGFYGGLENNCRIVMEKFMARELIRTCHNTLAHANDAAVDIFDLLQQSETMLSDISTKTTKTSAVGMVELLVQTRKQIDTWRHKTGNLTGVITGFARLDFITRGWQPTDLIILAARPSVGKTALALHFARTAAKAEIPVLIFSLEMPNKMLMMRMLATESETELDRILRGSLDDNQMDLLQKDDMARMAKYPIHFDDASELTPYILRAKVRKMKKKHSIGLVMIDYLQLMRFPGIKNREQEISNITREIKALAKEMEIPIIALSQLSRELEKRTGKRRVPQLSDLRESGAIEQDADVVLLAWGAEEEEIEKDPFLEFERYLKVAKNRNGDLGMVSMEFEKKFQRFKQSDKSANIALPPSGFVPVKDITEPNKSNLF